MWKCLNISQKWQQKWSVFHPFGEIIFNYYIQNCERKVNEQGKSVEFSALTPLIDTLIHKYTLISLIQRAHFKILTAFGSSRLNPALPVAWMEGLWRCARSATALSPVCAPHHILDGASLTHTVAWQFSALWAWWGFISKPNPFSYVLLA